MIVSYVRLLRRIDLIHNQRRFSHFYLHCLHRQQRHRHQLLSLNKIRIHHPTAITMGQVFSTSSSLDGTQNTTKSLKQSSSIPANTIRSSKLISAPISTLCESIDLTVTLDKAVCSKWREQHAVDDAQWYVELEVDIAHLQERHQLCVMPCKLDDDTSDGGIREHIHIPGRVIEDAVIQKPVESLCNVCALRIWLQCELDGRRLTNEIVMVMDVSHGGYKQLDDVFKLCRKIYGVESDSAFAR